jgi:2-methylcitrate dehydratase PrpD
MAGSISRRGFTAGLAVLPLVADFASGSARADAGVSATMLRLSRYMSAAGSSPLPQEALESTRQHVLDTFAAMISGSQLPPGRFALRLASAQISAPVATIVASTYVRQSSDAAFVNGMLAHSDETDDSHAPSQSHPGASIVPAAQACAEQFGLGGDRFLRAVALGYDIGTRFSMALGTGDSETPTHISTHALAGTLGSAAAAGCAAGLTEQQMRWLIDYATQQASGIRTWRRDTDHIEKAFVFAGMPARNGVAAALLVQAGATGVDDVLSGEYNFLSDYAPQADASRLTDQLGVRFEITRTNIKKWTVGSPIQAPLDALDLIRREHPFRADQVRTVTVRLARSEAMTVDDRAMPDISLQHMLAVMLIDGTASFKAAHDKARMADAGVLRQRAKIKLIGDPELEKRLPARVAIVEVMLDDGRAYEQTVAAVRGTAQNPMSRDEVVTKCRDLMSPVLGADQSSRLIDAVLHLERLDQVVKLRPLLQRKL